MTSSFTSVILLPAASNAISTMKSRNLVPGSLARIADSRGSIIRIFAMRWDDETRHVSGHAFYHGGITPSCRFRVPLPTSGQVFYPSHPPCYGIFVSNSIALLASKQRRSLRWKTLEWDMILRTKYLPVLFLKFKQTFHHLGFDKLRERETFWE